MAELIIEKTSEKIGKNAEGAYIEGTELDANQPLK
jgi:hypothetical protein